MNKKFSLFVGLLIVMGIACTLVGLSAVPVNGFVPTPTPTESTPVIGITREVNGNVLPGVSITLEGMGSVVNNQNGQYQIIATAIGNYAIVAHKDGFRDRIQTVYIAGLGQDFAVTCNLQGTLGLIPNAPDLGYALYCVNLWLYPPNPDTGLDLPTVLEVINAWLYPVTPTPTPMPSPTPTPTPSEIGGWQQPRALTEDEKARVVQIAVNSPEASDWLLGRTDYQVLPVGWYAIVWQDGKPAEWWATEYQIVDDGIPGYISQYALWYPGITIAVGQGPIMQMQIAVDLDAGRTAMVCGSYPPP